MSWPLPITHSSQYITYSNLDGRVKSETGTNFRSTVWHRAQTHAGETLLDGTTAEIESVPGSARRQHLAHFSGAARIIWIPTLAVSPAQ